MGEPVPRKPELHSRPTVNTNGITHKHVFNPTSLPSTREKISFSLKPGLLQNKDVSSTTDEESGLVTSEPANSSKDKKGDQKGPNEESKVKITGQEKGRQDEKENILKEHDDVEQGANDMNGEGEF